MSLDRTVAVAAGLLTVLLASGCSTNTPSSDTNASTATAAFGSAGTEIVDHIIVAIDSLERGIELLREATGVTATFGGTHPGGGTQNALISLGPRTYMELIAPNPNDERGPEMFALYSGFRDMTPAGWAAQADDARAMNADFMSRGLPDGRIAPGSRVTTAGDTLKWVTIAPWPRGVDWVIPFFIEWVAPTPHPASTTPTGCTLAGIVLRTPQADTTVALLRKAGVMVDVEQLAEPSLRFELDCPTGRVVIGD